MTIKELKDQLSKYSDDSIVLCGSYNGYTETYGVVDHSWEEYFERSVYNDLYGTPGQIDGRLMDKKMLDPKQKIVYIGTDFPMNHGIGKDEEIKHDIQSLNEDPNWLWKHNGFDWIYDEDGPYWSYLKEFGEANDKGEFPYEMINYYKDKGDDWYTCELHCKHSYDRPPQLVTLINPSYEDIIRVMKFLGFEKTLEM